MNDNEIIDNILNKNSRSKMLNDLPTKINITIEDIKNIDGEELESIRNSDEEKDEYVESNEYVESDEYVHRILAVVAFILASLLLIIIFIFCFVIICVWRI